MEFRNFFSFFYFPITVEGFRPLRTTCSSSISKLDVKIILVIWATELDTDPSSSTCQPNSIDHRSRGTVLDMLTTSSKSTRARSSSTALQFSGQPSSIRVYRARYVNRPRYVDTELEASHFSGGTK